MLRTLRTTFAACGSLAILTMVGCNDDANPLRADGVVQVTRSVDGVVTAQAGQTRPVSITFAAGPATPLSGFAISSAQLQGLPVGWSGPASHSCPSLTSTDNCMLNLTFAPTTVSAGVVTLDYSYRASSGASKTGSVAIEYRSTVSNSVTAVAGPSAQIRALAGGGSQAVAVTFNTDDGNVATELEVTTDLSALPAGWSSESATFECDEMSTGNGCQLLLDYAPASVTSGTLVLSYGYNDNSGVAKTGSISIDYAGTTHNNLVGTAAPSGQVNAAIGGSGRNVTVTFTTDDGHPVSNVALLSSLTALPAGWASASPAFTCTNASVGNGCELSLTYAPPAVGSGVLTLQYSYDDNSGTSRNGSVNIPYAALSDNSVVGATSPAGQIVAAIGANQAVTVTFTTDDAYPASSLSVTTDLASLPAGWSSSSPTFSCGAVATGNSCQLGLSYAPSAAGSGTLSLNYSYINHAGLAKNGTVAIQYLATAQHVYAAALFDELHYCDINSDGTLNNCTPTGGFSGGAPAIAFNGNRAYVGDFYNNVVSVCSVAADGSLSGCVNTGSNFHYPFVATISGNYLYVGNGQVPHTITYCTIESSGNLTNCAETPAFNTVTEGLAFANGRAYIGQPHSDQVTMCQQNADGSLTGCQITGAGFDGPEDLAMSGGYAFVTNTHNSTVSTCTVDSNDGTLSSCFYSNIIGQPMGIALRGNQAYMSTRGNGICLCDVSNTGVLSNCATTNGGASFSLLVQVAVH